MLDDRPETATINPNKNAMQTSSFERDMLTEIYISAIPECEIASLGYKERDEEIARATSDKVRREKYYSWRLLEYALEKSYGMSISDIAPTRNENGKWISEKIELSISHTDKVCAVALSPRPVGIDIEEISDRSIDRLAKRALSDAERDYLASVPSESRLREFFKLWCIKEATFKLRGERAFIPSSIDALPLIDTAITVTQDGADYALAVASEHSGSVRIIQNIDILAVHN